MYDQFTTIVIVQPTCELVDNWLPTDQQRLKKMFIDTVCSHVLHPVANGDCTWSFTQSSVVVQAKVSLMPVVPLFKYHPRLLYTNVIQDLFKTLQPQCNYLWSI